MSRALSAWPRGVLAVTVPASLLVFGPLPAAYYYPNNWTNHGLFAEEYNSNNPYSDTRTVRPRRISPFYGRLSALPTGAVLIVEVPWPWAWEENPYPYYQAVHRQRMHVGCGSNKDWLCRGAEFHFQNAVHVADATELRRRKVRYVIFHKRLHEEILAGPGEIVDVSEWVRYYRLAYGAPVYEDSDIVVFELGGRTFTG